MDTGLATKLEELFLRKAPAYDLFTCRHLLRQMGEHELEKVLSPTELIVFRQGTYIEKIEREWLRDNFIEEDGSVFRFTNKGRDLKVIGSTAQYREAIEKERDVAGKKMYLEMEYLEVTIEQAKSAMAESKDAKHRAKIANRIALASVIIACAALVFSIIEFLAKKA